jgi:Zn-dependent protease
MMNELTLIQLIAVWILPVIFAITVHEVAHGWVAKKRGDKTAWMLGRLTLNPIKHIDPIGTLLVPGFLLIAKTGFIFGWAKPVPVNARNLKNPVSDMAIVAAAGPLSNILMAFGWALFGRMGLILSMDGITQPMMYMSYAGIQINLVLAIINLLPIPPLDGSRILSALLPRRWAWYYSQIERYGFFVLLLLLWTGVLSSLLGYPLGTAQQLFFSLAGLK